MRTTFVISTKLPIQEELREMYNIKYSGQAIQSLKIHYRCLTICTIVLTHSISSTRSSAKSDKMREIIQYGQTSGNQFMLTQYFLTSAIVRLFQQVQWQTRKGFNSQGIQVQAHWSCSTLVLQGSIGIWLRKQELYTKSYLRYCYHSGNYITALKISVQLRTTTLEQEVLLQIK